MKTILLIEDDEKLSRGIRLMLCKEGYSVFAADKLEEADRIWNTNTVDMVISDIFLPDGSGLDFGKKIHEKSDVYLIYLTALDQETDIISGYNTGADDYITKPFSVNALVAKVNALMRRIQEKDAARLYSGELEVSVKNLQVKKGNQKLALSKTEMLLLICLMENAGQIVPKETILENVWGVDGLFVDENTVTVNISRLKTKLETNAIANVRGIGYLWTDNVIKK